MIIVPYTLRNVLSSSFRPLNNHLNLIRSFPNLTKRNKTKKRMAPKKQETHQKLLLGRPGNNLSIGIVGMPNVGKSTFFQAITKSQLGNPANFPYATIDPEEAKTVVPDERFDWLCKLYKPKSEVPASLTVIDIAGLTKDASKGEGLGNKFLSHIKAVDAIYQMVRAFNDPEITHVEGNVDPVRDLDLIKTELQIKDVEFSESHIETLKKAAGIRSNTSIAKAPTPAMKKALEEIAVVEKVQQYLKDGNDVRCGDWSNFEVECINRMNLLTAKPVLYLVNLSQEDYVNKKNKYLPKIFEWVKKNNGLDSLEACKGFVFPVSVALEETLASGESVSAGEKEVVSALPKIIVAGYTALNLIRYFTCGPDEVRAWTIRKGTKAPAAAGIIHTDFQNTFIQAEIMHYNDLKELGSDNAVREKGKLMKKGKDYIVEDGDICLWKAGAAKG